MRADEVINISPHSQSRSPKAIDAHVGGRLRLRRLLVKMSQEDLANALGITFQQVQKYEKGSNRIGAGRLFEMAQILGVSVQYFFEGLGSLEESSADEEPIGGQTDTGQTDTGQTELGDNLRDFLSSREAVEFNRAFMDIECSKSRRAVLTLVRALGDLADRKD